MEHVFAISNSQTQCIKKAKEQYEKSTKSKKIKVNGLPYDDLSKFTNTPITKLDISNTEANQRPFVRNSSSLLELEATHNFLTNFDEIGELELPNIYLINFSYNALTNLKYGLFYKENSLEVLDLSFNCLETFHMGHELEVHHNLTHIDLRGNLLKEFKYIPRGKMFELEELDLSFNQLTDFSTHTLIVHNLILTNNKIRTIRYHLKNRETFHGFIKLSAQFNEIQRFESPYNFSLLNLSHNAISFFDDILINQIMFLDLSYNLIESNVDSVHHDDEDYVYNSVQHLNLEGNQIRNLKYVKCYFPETEDINVNNNPVLTNLTDGDLHKSNATENKTCVQQTKDKDSSKVTVTETATSTKFPEVIKESLASHQLEPENSAKLSASSIVLLVFVVALALAGFGFIAYKQRFMFFGLKNDVRFEEFQNENEIAFNRSPFA